MTRKLFIHTPEMVQFILDHNKGTPAKDFAEMFNKRFGTNRTAEHMKTYRANHHLNSGLDGRFKKGQISWNKGKRWDEYVSPEGQMNSRKTCFRKGHAPYNTYPVGAEKITKDGYIQVKVSDKDNGPGMSRKNWVLKQRLIWEQHHGPVPEGHMIIFLDGDIRNFDIGNLACVSLAENIRLNQKKLRFTAEPELTQAGISIVRIEEKIGSRNKKNEDKSQGEKHKK